jgi:hypothetical protein
VKITKEHPEILDQYREAKRQSVGEGLSHEDIAASEGVAEPDWDALLRTVLEIVPGQATANVYHLAVESLLQALFHPSLVMPQRESRIHNGRKRIDIRFTNSSRSGYFWRVKEHHHVPAGYVIVECKNYSEDVANPEIDQVAGRFNPVRGRFGLLVCRSIEDQDRCLDRCRDTFHDDRGWIIVLDDDDLKRLVGERKEKGSEITYEFLEERFGELIS